MVNTKKMLIIQNMVKDTHKNLNPKKIKRCKVNDTKCIKINPIKM